MKIAFIGIIKTGKGLPLVSKPDGLGIFVLFHAANYTAA